MNWKLVAHPTGTTGKQWNLFSNPRPYVTVSGFAFDDEGKFLALHRSKEVRSARNCWSLPSGLHEIGVTGPQQFCTELEEELNVVADPNSAVLIGNYENVRPDDKDAPGAEVPGWHWFIVVYAVRAKTLSTFINKEPHKHDQTLFLDVNDLDWLNLGWEPALGSFLSAHTNQILSAWDKFSTLVADEKQQKLSL
jgi:ADP-ribose pyrophosphatase YjhB (NUDIX family)